MMQQIIVVMTPEEAMRLFTTDHDTWGPLTSHQCDQVIDRSEWQPHYAFVEEGNLEIHFIRKVEQ